MRSFLNAIERFSRYTDVVAGAALVFIMLLTSLDVVLRYMGMPILGSYDMVSLGGAFIIGFAVPRSSWDRTHVSVDILVERIPERRVIFDVSTRVLALALFAVLTWNFFKLGFGFYRTGEVTLTLEFPLYPIPFVLGFCSLIECFVLLADVVRIGIAGGSHE
jgi:TRAP-type C4-dicarboxylate transport system permease small subunit